MKNECSIIRDNLPLYVENMVSELSLIHISEPTRILRIA